VRALRGAESALAPKARDFVVIGGRHILGDAEGAEGAESALAPKARDFVVIGRKNHVRGAVTVFTLDLAPRFKWNLQGGGPKGARPCLAQRSEASASTEERDAQRSSTKEKIRPWRGLITSVK